MEWPFSQQYNSAISSTPVINMVLGKLQLETDAKKGSK